MDVKTHPENFCVIGLEKVLWDDIAADLSPEQARMAPGVRSFDVTTFQDGITVASTIAANLVAIIVARPHLTKLARRLSGSLRRKSTPQITLSLKLEGQTVASVAATADEDELLKALLDIVRQMDAHDTE
ncbi:hypothetical protein OG426_30675 [Streptomyces canus]|uniref:hypothetical protein n=1 Tax=Streptomyces canus TaxID=58343 RepID=UPI002257418E|nr:hypothetical protein [Streptomyces canus]MCX4858286.1 hypothetical protein [Streptomyces canus]WSW36499.1 hypothetical protein OG426_30675 [Streptomyces canus]